MKRAIKLCYICNDLVLNTHHFHQAFTSLTILPNETVKAFLKRFNIGRTNAEKLGNVYSNVERVDFLLTAMEPCTEPAYQLWLKANATTLTRISTKKPLNRISSWLMKKEEQISKKNRMDAQGFIADATTKSTTSEAKANSAQSESVLSYKPATTQDMSKIDCNNATCWDERRNVVARETM